MSGDTFSVEVLGFAKASTDPTLVKSIQDAFGIDADSAKTLIGQAPVRVKKGAGMEDARILVGQLLALTADVKITNELTGEERLYKAEANAKPAGGAAVTTTGSGRGHPDAGTEWKETTSGGTRRDADWKLSSGSRGSVNAASSMLEALKLARERQQAGGPAKGPPPATRHPSTPPGPEGSVEPGPSRPPLSRPPSGHPPSAHPSVAPSDTVVEDCSNCKKKVARGDICGHCGWSNDHKKRLSPSGKEPELLPGVGVAPKVVLALLGLGGAVAAFLFLGALEAATPIAIALALFVFLEGSSYAFRRDGWTLPFDMMKPDEKKRVRNAKLRFIIMGVIFLLLGVAAPLPGLVAKTELRLDSFGNSWVVELPDGDAQITKGAIRLTVGAAKSNATFIKAKPDRSDVSEYAMVRAPIEKKPNAEQLPEMLKSALKGTLGGEVEVGETSEAKLTDADIGIKATFKGTVEGTPAEGEARMFGYGRTIVLFLYFGPNGNAAPKGTAYLDAISVDKSVAGP